MYKSVATFGAVFVPFRFCFGANSMLFGSSCQLGASFEPYNGVLFVPFRCYFCAIAVLLGSLGHFGAIFCYITSNVVLFASLRCYFLCPFDAIFLPVWCSLCIFGAIFVLFRCCICAKLKLEGRTCRKRSEDCSLGHTKQLPI